MSTNCTNCYKKDDPSIPELLCGFCHVMLFCFRCNMRRNKYNILCDACYEIPCLQCDKPRSYERSSLSELCSEHSIELCIVENCTSPRSYGRCAKSVLCAEHTDVPCSVEGCDDDRFYEYNPHSILCYNHTNKLCDSDLCHRKVDYTNNPASTKCEMFNGTHCVPMIKKCYNDQCYNIRYNVIESKFCKSCMLIDRRRAYSDVCFICLDRFYLDFHHMEASQCVCKKHIHNLCLFETGKNTCLVCYTKINCPNLEGRRRKRVINITSEYSAYEYSLCGLGLNEIPKKFWSEKIIMVCLRLNPGDIRYVEHFRLTNRIIATVLVQIKYFALDLSFDWSDASGIDEAAVYAEMDRLADAYCLEEFKC